MLADSLLGRERTLAVCLAATAVATVGLAFSRGVALLAVVGSALWLVRSPVMALADALALDRLGSERRDAYTVRLWMSASFAVGAISWGIALTLTTIDVAATGTPS